MATLTTITVKESGTRDYSDLSTAISTEATDLVTDDVQLTFEISGTWTADDSPIDVTGYTTDATRFIKIVTIGSSRHNGSWDSNAHRISKSTSGSCIINREIYTVIDGLQVASTYTGAGSNQGIFNFTASNVTVRACIVKGTDRTGTGQYIGLYTSGAQTGIWFYNNLVYDINSGSASYGMFLGTDAGGCHAYNNTVENCDIGIFTGYSDVIAVNNIIWNCTTPLSGTFNTGGASGENFTDASSLSYGDCGSCGTGDQVSQSDPFENLAGEDYHLASGSAAIGTGTNFTSDFTTDIDGDTRHATAAWDKGADKFVSSAEELTADLKTFTLTKLANTQTVQYKQIADLKAFSLTALSNTMVRGVPLTADLKTFSLTALASTTAVGHKLIAATKTFTLSNLAATTTPAFGIPADTMAFTMTALSNTMIRDIPLSADLKTFTLTALTATTAKGGGSATLTADTKAFTMNALAATTTVDYALVAETKAFNVTALSNSTVRGVLLAASLATFTLTGLSATTTPAFGITADLKTFTLTALSATTSSGVAVQDAGEDARDNIFTLLSGASLEGQPDGISKLSRNRVFDLLDGNITL